MVYSTDKPKDWSVQATDLQHHLQRFLEHLDTAKHRPRSLEAAGWRPSVDMYETEQHLVVLADLAGAEPSLTEVMVTDQTVTISGLRQSGQTPEDARYHLMEISQGHFERVVTLPVTVDSRRARARLDGGLLQIRLPKSVKNQATAIKVSGHSRQPRRH